MNSGGFSFVLENHLQFIFRCIDQKDPGKPYTLTLSINDEGAYEGRCNASKQCMLVTGLKWVSLKEWELNLPLHRIK